MRDITTKMVLVAMLMTLSHYSTGTPVPQNQDKVNLQAMTVAQLERAADEARSPERLCAGDPIFSGGTA